jgi:hypothetical protein
MSNPIKYTFLKDARKFADEKELRISLSTLGMGEFALNDGRTIEFPPCLQMLFDFKAAIADGTIRQIQAATGCDSAFLATELRKLF